MKKVLAKTECDECGQEFDGEFVQHEKPEDDWEWESEPIDGVTYDELGRELMCTETPEPVTYPHIHEVPTVTCHYCPNCRAEHGLEATK